MSELAHFMGLGGIILQNTRDRLVLTNGGGVFITSRPDHEVWRLPYSASGELEELEDI